LGRHEEVEQRNQRLVNGGQEGLFLKPFEPVIALSIHEPQCRFFVRLEPEARKPLPFFLRSLEQVKLVPMEVQNGDGDGVSDVREGLECPCRGLVEEGIEAHPSGSNVQIRRGAAMTSLVHTRFPLRFAGHFFPV
jgi:hypothetical protein